MKRLGVYLVFVVALWAQKPYGVVDELKDSSLLIQHSVVSQQALTPTGAERIAKVFLAEARERKLGALTVYADSAVAAGQTQFCEGSYQQWKLFYDSFPKERLRAAQVISTPAGGVLLFRGDNGQVSRQILRGTDPTVFEMDGVSFEILYIAGRTRSKFERCGIGTIEPMLFLKTSAALSQDLAKRATAQLASRLGVNHLWTHFRNDIWFLCGEFPVFYPFSPPGSIPTETAYRDAPQFACYISCDGVPKC